MHFTKIRLSGLHVIDLPIANALPTDKYILKDAGGLGPPGVDIFIQNTRDSAAFYQNKNTQLREIVLRVALNPNYSLNERVSDLRETFYGMLSPGLSEAVRVELLDGAHSLMFLTGHVKQLEIAPFSQTPELQITIACVEKYFTESAPHYLLPENTKQLRIQNQGSAETGFHFELMFNAASSIFVMKDQKSNYLGLNYDFLPDDRLIVDTTVNNRGVWVERADGTPFRKSILSGIAYGSKWFMLRGGENVFDIESSSFIWGDVYYTPLYWGI